MKTIILMISLLIIFTVSLSAQSEFEEFISRISSISDNNEKTAVIDSFMTYAKNNGIPFVENKTANFIYRGNAGRVQLAGDFTIWAMSIIDMTNIQGTNFFYHSIEFEPDARLDYKFIIDEVDWILDPNNPRTCEGGWGTNSELAMPDYVYPWEIKYNGSISHGKIVNDHVYSSNMGWEYQLKIYLPPEYNPNSGKKYPAIYFQDGFEYISLANANNVLDNLIDIKSIEPVIGVFVKPNNRDMEYIYNDQHKYIAFFGEELVPYIDRNYKTIASAEKRLVMGDSFGGVVSSVICWQYPETFGNMALQSPDFGQGDYIPGYPFTDELKQHKIYLQWGTYESYIATFCQEMSKHLEQNNFDIKYAEYHEGHSWGQWKSTLDDVFTFIFPNSSANMNDVTQIKHGFSLKRNYPNPFNQTTVIGYELGISGHVKLKIYDLLGREVAVPVNGYQTAGFHEIRYSAADLTSGIYLYRLENDKNIQTRGMVLIK